jgi:hypothetical protein
MRKIRPLLRVPRAVACFALAPLCLAALAACSSGSLPRLPDGGLVTDGGVLCTESEQCPAAQGCIENICTPLPCGGCDSDQVCSVTSSTCVPAQGATCPPLSAGGCPEGYSCNSNNVCSQPCTLDTDCPSGLVCNSNTSTCAQCIFDSNCASVAGKPRCDPTSGNCVACLEPIDCTSTLGSDHFCDTNTNTCVTGCETSADCNLSNNEFCNGATSTTPGMCVQCTAATEATQCTVSAPACDAAGQCVICTADHYCGPATPRCDTTTQTCVECLPANNANGSDCGYQFSSGGPRDPHDEAVCDPTAKDCVPGCATDVNCGCPVDPSTGKPTACAREYSQEHCDPTRTTSADVPDAGTEGACVECTANSHCFCKIEGNQGSTDPSTGLACNDWPQAGSFDGARCVSDSCVQGCDTNADCPADKLCSLSGPTAHQCVECSCANSTINDAPGPCVAGATDCGWCSDPTTAGALGGCGPVHDLADGGSSAGAASQVCDALTLTCRLKRQDEACDRSEECGDPRDPTIGACIPGAQFCVQFAHAYAPDSPNLYCSPGRVTGRCGIPCDDSQDNTCSEGVSCPSGSTCKQATAVDQPPGGIEPSGEYCTANTCTTSAP